MLSRKRIAKSISAVISVSHPIADALKKECDIESEVIVNGIEHESFFPDGQKSDYILFVGRPQKPKGFPTFIKAAKILQTESPDIKIKVVSPGAIERIENGIEFICYKDRPQLRNLYSQAGVYVCASNGESFGLPPLEAMACGTAVVLTDTVGTREYSQNGQNCLIVPVGDAISMSSSIKSLLRNSGLRNKLETNGLVMAQKYEWGKSQKKFEEFLKKLSNLDQKR